LPFKVLTLMEKEIRDTTATMLEQLSELVVEQVLNSAPDPEEQVNLVPDYDFQR